MVFQSITAGKTPIGTKIQAKLSIATLLNRTVVPRNAKFCGEVVVSEARTTNQPSRLSVRLDSVSWKNGSAPVKVFLTARFYPGIAESRQNSHSGPVLWNQGSNNPGSDGEYKPSGAGRAELRELATSGKDEGRGQRTRERWNTYAGLQTAQSQVGSLHDVCADRRRSRSHGEIDYISLPYFKTADVIRRLRKTSLPMSDGNGMGLQHQCSPLDSAEVIVH